jgi:hypothetical protein
MHLSITFQICMGLLHKPTNNKVDRNLLDFGYPMIKYEPQKKIYIMDIDMCQRLLFVVDRDIVF